MCLTSLYYMKVELLGQGSKCQGTLGLGFLLHHLHSPLDLEMYFLIPSFHKPPSWQPQCDPG